MWSTRRYTTGGDLLVLRIRDGPEKTFQFGICSFLRLRENKGGNSSWNTETESWSEHCSFEYEPSEMWTVVKWLIWPESVGSKCWTPVPGFAISKKTGKKAVSSSVIIYPDWPTKNIWIDLLSQMYNYMHLISSEIQKKTDSKTVISSIWLPYLFCGFSWRPPVFPPR